MVVAHWPPAQRARRRGWTLLELLVVVAIIGLMLALVLAGVQWSRTSARKAMCMARLRDLGMACSAYTSTFGTYPPGQIAAQVAPWTAQLLPYLDSSAAERINYSVLWREENETIGMHRIEAFVCPAAVDLPRLYGRVTIGFGVTAFIAESSYVGCGGSGRLGQNKDGIFPNGGYGEPHVRPADVTDGLSKTSLFCEADPRSREEALRTGIGAVVVLADLPFGYNDEQIIAACLDNISGAEMSYHAPSGWLGFPFYDHALPPNRAGCTSDRGIAWSSTTPASSRHPGIVNNCFADGHVSSISDAIDRQVWRQLGSRNDGGPTSSDY